MLENNHARTTSEFYESIGETVFEIKLSESENICSNLTDYEFESFIGSSATLSDVINLNLTQFHSKKI